jgi:NAD(P)-dependent dehydrogenase (short-subunit alcohol dehydrogenase family)
MTTQQQQINEKIEASAFREHLEVPPIRQSYQGSGKLTGKVALITGGDSGIGRAVAVHFAREGADVAIVFDQNEADARETIRLIEAEGRRGIRLQADLSEEMNCVHAVQQTVAQLGGLHILVNNAGTHTDADDIQKISARQLQRTFEVNMYSFFYCSKAALAIMEDTAVIINTASVVAYRGSDHLLDYAATKGAIVAFTRSLSANVAGRRIRVNAVAPGPVWTPLVVGSFPESDLAKFGKDTPLGRAGYPQEVAPAYVYLASDDSTFVTGQTLHVNGGDIING